MKRLAHQPDRRFCDFDRAPARRLKSHATRPALEPDLLMLGRMTRESLQRRVLELMTTLTAGACLIVLIVGTA